MFYVQDIKTNSYIKNRFNDIMKHVCDIIFFKQHNFQVNICIEYKNVRGKLIVLVSMEIIKVLYTY